MSSREEFEDWWKHAPFIQSHVAKSAAYGIWQASRAALVVELPYCFETYGYSAEVARVATDGCAEAIEDAGITVRRTE